jgi:hypothetical protein
MINMKSSLHYVLYMCHHEALKEDRPILQSDTSVLSVSQITRRSIGKSPLVDERF